MSLALQNRMSRLEGEIIRLQAKAEVWQKLAELDARIEKLEGEIKAMKARMGKKQEHPQE